MPKRNAASAFPATNHDHQACVTSALARAVSVCEARGLRLTPIRRRVLELVWSNHRPSKAYDLLEAIRSEPFSAAPPTVYRALDFLAEAGLIHRIESLNAFVGCDTRHAGSQPMFLICRHCERAAEVIRREIDESIGHAASGAGFKVERQMIEISGLCRQCTKA